MKTITIKITCRFDDYDDISDEIMFDDIVKSIVFNNDFEFYLEKEETK